MSEFIDVAIHPSAQPDEFMASLRRSFEGRSIDPKFHYTSPRQAQMWLALHRKYSPYVNSRSGGDIYDSAFNWAAGQLTGKAIHLVSLACGGAGKELRLVKTLQRAGQEIFATVSDISVPLVIAGYQTLAQGNVLAGTQAVAFDLLESGELNQIFKAKAPDHFKHHLVTCFGLMPNVEPLVIGARLAALACQNGVLLVGANLVPELNYEQGTRDILGQYDNAETQGWLSLLLTDYGFQFGHDEIRFSVEPCASLPGLLQIVAQLQLRRAQTIELGGAVLNFSAGETLRLFFSNRFTPALLRQVFQLSKMKILREWISAEENEGIIACEIADR